MYQVNFLPWRQQRITRNKRRCFALFILQSCLVAIVVIYNSSQQQFEQTQWQITKMQLEQHVAQKQQQIKVINEKQVFHSRVKDEVAFGLKRQKLSQSEIEKRTLEALECCHLQDVANSHPLDLDAGQRRMVAVASLSAISPKVLLLDEPTRDFDARWLACFERWLALQRTMGTTLLAISHDLDFVARHFKRVIHLSAGKIIADGPPETVLNHPDLQPESVLPTPTLYSLSHALDIALESDPKRWADKFIRISREPI